MNPLNPSLKLNRRFWSFLFALVSGSFITGMTGYVTMGSNYPYVFIAAVAINYILVWFTSNLGSEADFSIYQRTIKLFDGKLGQFFSSFIGMIILIILLFIATGESKTAAMAMKQVIQIDIPLEYYLIPLCTIALLPIFLGVQRSLSFAFFMFIALIALRTTFIVILFINKQDLPAWSMANMYNAPVLADFMGSQGIIYIAIRLAFWSLIAIELLNIWSKSGVRNHGRMMAFLIATLILTFTMIPGIFISGILPTELWQLIVLSEQACYGACPSLAMGYNLGGTTGLYLMGSSTVVTHLLLVSVCYLLITRVISSLSARQLFFGRLSVNENADKKQGTNSYVLITTFVLSLILSMLNLSASSWVGLGLYLSFGLIMLIQMICLVNARFQWFENKISLCVPTALSIVMMAILFYSGFKGVHREFLNYSLAIFCFSLWVAASSVVYLTRLQKD